VLTGGAGLRAMTRAFEHAFGVADGFTGVAMAGRTDASILGDALAACGMPSTATAVASFRDAYLRYLSEEIDKPGPGKGVMPGIGALLERLALEPGKHLALLTGNYEAGARAKLEYFDLWRYFRCGAFGDEAPDRNGLFAQAVAAVEACDGRRFAPRDVVIIGDTPLDVACARYGGGRSIAVATGSHSAAALSASGADVVFEDLSNTDDVLAAIEG
jgi:phosphoglycolate phosphatase